ncbi:hypothetical protein Taro_041026 [Colocasia esculenta]|uniref:Uncharacterized protein n=1 Tax=Colocasia esculenta TaxID=4460 RepID=A0A843WAE9_COLES|nr:hypothetical protein [Colocasia esculenta]
MIRARAAGCSCCCAACVASIVAQRVRAVVARLALDSLASALLSELSGCSVCRVASLVERCDTCLWLLLAWCWLVVSSSEVLPELFSVGFGGSEGLRYAASVGLAGAFWRVFPERCLGGSGRGSPRTGLCCFCSSAGCSIFSDGPCCLVVGLCILVKVLPRIALCHSWQRFFPGVLRVRFGPPLCCPYGSKCAVVCLGVVGQDVVPLAVCLAAALDSLFCCSFPSFSVARVGLRVPVVRMVASFFAPCVLSQMVVW